MRKEKGFTLIELVVSMGIFIVILMVIAYAFENIYKNSGQQTKSVVTQIEGMLGLEMLRTDIASAGFALPWAFDFIPNPTYREVSDGAFPAPAADIGITAATFDGLRDIPGLYPAVGSQNPPRAVVSGLIPIAGNAWTGPDYLVLKSALLALDNPSVGKWGYVNYSTNAGTNANTSYIKRVSDSYTDLNVADKVITIQSFFSPSGNQTKTLKMSAANIFYYDVPNSYQPTDNAFKPADLTQSFFAYAISNNASLNMPYNRADYYINYNANLRPASCNSRTGVLFKAVAGQNADYKGSDNTTPLIYPLLNCVGDFKVVYNLDMDGDGNPRTYYMDVDPAVPSDIALGTTEGATIGNVQATLQAPDLLRQRLKTLIIYVLAHEGSKDTNYRYPVVNANNVITIGGYGAQKVWSQAQMANAFGADWFNYRWKVYTISVNMTNLQ